MTSEQPNFDEQRRQILQYEQLIEPISWGVLLLFVGLLLLPDQSGFLQPYQLYLVVLTAALFTVVWFHFISPALSFRKKLLWGTLAYSVFIELLVLFSGGLYSPLSYLLYLPLLGSTWQANMLSIQVPFIIVLLALLVNWLAAAVNTDISVLRSSQVLFQLLSQLMGVSIIGGFSLFLTRMSFRRQSDLDQRNAELQAERERLGSTLADVERLRREREAQAEQTARDNQTLNTSKSALLNVMEDMGAAQGRAEAMARQQRELAEQIRHDRDRDEAVLTSIADAVLIISADGQFEKVNAMALQISALDAADLIDKPYQALCFTKGEDIEPCHDFLEHALEQGGTWDLPQELNVRRPSGELVPVAGSVSQIRGQRGVVLVLRDVRRQREVDRQKTEFISIASHQLRTPLSSLKWNLEMLLSGDFGKVPKAVGETLDGMQQSNQRMIDLVNDLLDISRIESGRVKLESAPSDLLAVLRSAAEELQPLASQRQVTLKLDLPAQLPLISLDPKQIRQAVGNLLSNGIKYTPSGGRVTLHAVQEAGVVRVSVEDTGLGVPVDQQHRLFERFFRADNVVRREVEGTGLGLYVVKTIINSSGGQVGFKSEEGNGSTFWFTLPLSPVRDAVAQTIGRQVAVEPAPSVPPTQAVVKFEPVR